MDKISRVILANQYAILASMGIDKEDNMRRIQALKDGIPSFYDFKGFREEVSSDQVLFVQHILDMFAHIGYSYSQLDDADQDLDPYYWQFEGFDINTEVDHVHILDVFRRDNRLPRYIVLLYADDPIIGKHLCPHHPTLWRYGAMLRRYRNLVNSDNIHIPLAKEDILNICGITESINTVTEDHE